jgi:hypothetical protein
MTLAFSAFILLASVTESSSKKIESIDISIVNASFVPLKNTDANQVKVYLQYDFEDERVQNQLITAVMEVYAQNGTLLKTTSVGTGFTLQKDGGQQVLKTTFHDKSLESVSFKVLLTDLTKKTPLSNTITKDLELEEEASTGGHLFSKSASIQDK